MNYRSFLFVGALLFFSITTHASTYGTVAEANNTVTNGGLGTTSASVSHSTTVDGNASSQADASIDGVSYMPVLKASASMSNPVSDDFPATAGAYGYQTFSYTGLDTTIFLDLNLDGSVLNNLTATLDARIDADAYMVRGDLLGNGSYMLTDFPNDVCPWLGSPTSADFQWAFGTGFCGSEATSVHTSMSLYEGDTNANGLLAFDVTDGDSFTIFASLQAIAWDGVADGFNTFTMDFSDDTGINVASAPNVSAVPVPAAAWLFGSALLGFFGFSRRKAKV